MFYFVRQGKNSAYLGSEVEVASDLSWLDLEERLVVVALGFEVDLGLEAALAGFVRQTAARLDVLGWLGQVREGKIAEYLISLPR